MHYLYRLPALPLVFGVLPTVISVAGGIAMIFLLARRGRRWWLRTVPIAVGAGLAGVLVVELVLWLWRPFPEALPPPVPAGVGRALCSLALTAGDTRAPRPRPGPPPPPPPR